MTALRGFLLLWFIVASSAFFVKDPFRFENFEEFPKPPPEDAYAVIYEDNKPLRQPVQLNPYGFMPPMDLE